MMSMTLRASANASALCKQSLVFEVREEVPLFCVVSRLAVQKGLDLVLDALPEFVRCGAQLVILGSGDASLEKRVSECGKRPIRMPFRCRSGMTKRKSHRLIAGSDVILMPSRYEPWRVDATVWLAIWHLATGASCWWAG